MSFSDETDAPIYHCKNLFTTCVLSRGTEKLPQEGDETPSSTVYILGSKLECIANHQMMHWFLLCVSSEPEDRDMNCVVCSLVQVMCDPHCRTVAGFQGLVQKEWITAGHKFLSRINYHRESDKEEVKERETTSSVLKRSDLPTYIQTIHITV